MGSRSRAVSLLALGLGLGSPVASAQAAPRTPPPPRAKTTPPPPPSSGSSPFLPTSRSSSTPSTAPSGSSGSSATPPAPSATPAEPEVETPDEPAAPPQDLSHTWGYSRATTGLQPRYVRSRDPTFAAPNPVGFYSGVSVQGNQEPPFPAAQKGTTPVVMTWTGFERAAEGSRVFFQLSAEAAYEVEHKELVVRVRMRNTRPNVRNNMRHLDLRYFQTPVRTVRLRRRGRDTVATLVLKRAAVADVNLVDGKAGYKLLVIQFSDGAETTNESPPPPPP